MKTICLSILAFLIYHSAVLADDVVIVLPEHNLLDEIAHIRGTKVSSDWSTITIQVDAIKGNFGDKYSIGTYVKFDKKVVFGLGEGAEYLASVNIINQQAKSLLEVYQKTGARSSGLKGSNFLRDLKAITTNINSLESKSPLKEITGEFLSVVINNYEVIQSMGAKDLRSTKLPKIRTLFDSIDFDLLKTIKENYAPYMSMDLSREYPLTALVATFQSVSFIMVSKLMNDSYTYTKVCEENNIEDYCIAITRKALAAEPLYDSESKLMNNYCQLALINDWSMIKHNAIPVTTLSDASSQYTVLRLKLLKEVPNYMSTLSGSAKSCLLNFRGNITTDLVRGTPAYIYYEKGIEVATRTREKKEASLTRLVSDASSQYQRAIDETLGDISVDSTQADSLYNKAIALTLAQLKLIDNYHGLSLSELKTHLSIKDIEFKIKENINQVSIVLSENEFKKREVEILLQKELEQAKKDIRSYVSNLTEPYGGSQTNLAELNQSIIENYDKLANIQFTKNNKPVDQLAQEKRSKLLNKVDNKKLLTATGVHAEFNRLKSESRAFSQRIGVPVFDDKHIELLEVKSHEYKLSLKQSSLRRRYKVPFKDGDKWLLTAPCQNGDIRYEFNLPPLKSLKTSEKKYTFNIFKLPFVYHGYAINQKNKEDIKSLQLKGYLTVKYRNFGKGKFANLQSANIDRKLVPKGYRYFKLNLSSGGRFNFEDSGMSFTLEEKRVTKGCKSEKIELVQSRDFDILNYQGRVIHSTKLTNNAN